MQMGITLLTFFFFLWSAVFTSIGTADAKRICFQRFGCFSMTKYFNAKHATLPSHPNVIQTKFHLYTRRNPRRGQRLNVNNIGSIKKSHFHPARKTVFIVHGFAHHSQKPWVIKMKNELLMRYRYNVITVDWRKGASYLTMSYLKAVANTHLVGAQIAFFIQILHDVTGLLTSSVHIIGHSLGAHVAGYAGKRLASNHLVLGRITGLDPAGPNFEGSDAVARLDKTDAKFVDVIHTNSAPFLLGGAGYRGQLGDVDFYPNGGKYQPGCEGLFKSIWRRGILNSATCHHMRAVEYFTASIRSSCLFPAFPCSTWKEFKDGKCFHKLRGHDIPLMGMQADKCKKHNQTMYLTTLSKSPYCVYNYVILISYSESKRKHNAIYVQLTGSKGITEKKKIQLGRGVGTKLEMITGTDIGELMSVELFYYGFSSFHIHNVRVNILHRNEMYVSCFDQLVKNSFWLFWTISAARYKREAFAGTDCESTFF